MAQHKVEHLTEHQERILAIIRRHITDIGEAPTVAKLCAETGRNAGAVHYQLRELEAKAAIVREPGRPRGIRLT
jgi:repressor LexA